MDFSSPPVLSFFSLQISVFPNHGTAGFVAGLETCRFQPVIAIRKSEDNAVTQRPRASSVERREREKHAADKDGDPASPALSAWNLKFDMHG